MIVSKRERVAGIKMALKRVAINVVVDETLAESQWEAIEIETAFKAINELRKATTSLLEIVQEQASEIAELKKARSTQ